MGKQKPIEIINPPNALKAKLGGALNLKSNDVIERAERALKNMSGEFETWLDEELTKLENAWKEHGDLTDRETQLDIIYGNSHDLKGLATTYGYPLITRYAASLCRLIATETSRAVAPKALIEAHIKACRSVMVQKIQAPDHPVGLALAHELETQTEQFADVT